MSSTDLDIRIRREAIDWFVRLSSGTATPRERNAWSAWRAADPAHEAAWVRIEGVSRTLGTLPGAIASPTLRRDGPSRRTVLRSLAGLGGAAALGYGVYAGGRAAGFGAVGGWGAALMGDARTAVGEQRRILLDDGSLLTLNTATAVDIRYDAATRAIRLHGGEILVETARERRAHGADDPRPLVVETRLGRVRALGTRFLMRIDDGELRVAVMSSAVEARALDGSLRRIEQGEQVLVGPDGIDPTQPLAPESDAWVDGSLIVDNARLADVVAELARYRRGRLVCDPSAAALRVSGAFPVRDTDQALAALAAALPVRVDRLSGYWVTVRAQGR